MKRDHRISIITSFIIIVLSNFSSPAANARDYYLDAVNGNDSWSGTSHVPSGTDGPWRTLAKVASFSSTVDFQPGTRILFKRGDRFVANFGLPITQGGAEGLPITFGAYGVGPQPVLQMSGPAIQTWVDQGNGIWLFQYTGTAVAGFWEDGVFLRHASDETLQDGQFFWKQGTGIYYRPADNNPAIHTTHYRGAAYGFAIENLSYLTFTDLHFAIGPSAIGGGGKTQPIHHLVIENCTFENITGPIFLYSDNGNENHDITIRNNTFLASGQAMAISALNGPEKNISIVIEGNRVIDIDANYNYKTFALFVGRGGDIGEGLGFQNLNNSRIAGNEISVGVRAAGIVLWTNPSSVSHGNTVERNHVHDIIGAGMAMFGSNTTNAHLGNVIRYNRISNCSAEDLPSEGGIRLSGMDAPGSNFVYNNTIQGCGTNIFLTALSQGFHVSNNISLYPLRRHVYEYGNTLMPTMDRNLYFPDTATGFKLGGYTGNFGWWQQATEQDQMSRSLDPLVVDTGAGNVHLTRNSPAIDMGESHGATTDFDGKPVVGAPDLGAHEFGARSNGESTTAGTVTGDFTATYVSDNADESLQEVLFDLPGNGSDYSYLEHTWTVDVSGGGNLSFAVEAHHDANTEGDDFVFAYSTNGVLFTDMLTVTKTIDDDTIQSYALPPGLNGPLYIRVRDTDHTKKRTALDALHIDQMYLQSQ